MKGSNNLLAGMSGSLGTLTAVIAKDGETILKGKISNMTNPRTAAQTAQRSAWTFTVIIARMLLSALRSCYAKKTVLQSAFNSFTSDAVKDIAKDAPVSVDLCMPIIQVSDGPTLISPTNCASLAATATPGDVVTVLLAWTFDAASFPEAATDTVCFIAANPTTGYVAKQLSGGKDRTDLDTSAPFIVQPSGVTFIYYFFLNPNTGEYSPSIYAGELSTNGSFTSA